MLVLTLALASTVALSTNSALAAADSGVHASCGNQYHCSDDNGICTMTANTPSHEVSFGNDVIRSNSAIACDYPGAKKIHLGSSFLQRFTCTWYNPFQTWFCGGPGSYTSVGEGENRDRWCGYPGTDALSCDWINPGYRSVGMSWDYDVKDDPANCFAFQQALNGTFTDQNGNLHIFHEVDTFGRLWGHISNGHACRGTFGQY